MPRSGLVRVHNTLHDMGTYFAGRAGLILIFGGGIGLYLANKKTDEKKTTALIEEEKAQQQLVEARGKHIERLEGIRGTFKNRSIAKRTACSALRGRRKKKGFEQVKQLNEKKDLSKYAEKPLPLRRGGCQ